MIFNNRIANIIENYTNKEEETAYTYIQEASTKKKYKCPYCDERLYREKLSGHIDKKHSEMTSEEFSSNRIAFNTINKKTHGRCVQCGKETKWNESTIRYNRFCSEKCKDEYVKIAKARMVSKYGKEYILDDPEQQNKMLAGRKISGTYKSSKGETFSYVGSYEKKLLEFEDVILGLGSLDIVMPGPTIKYEFDGKEHFWITDQYIAPFNLVIDVKDGGDNPNNRDMPEYRAKQIAKEKAIADLGIYNYIRLTDNKFDQLLSVMMAIKYSMIDNPRDTKPIIRINENTEINMEVINELGSAITNCIPNKREVYIVPYLKNAVFAGVDINDNCNMPTINYAISFTNAGMPFTTYVNGSFYEIPAHMLKEYKMFHYNIDNTRKIDKNFTPSNILESIIGERVPSPDMLVNDNRFDEVESYLSYLESVTNIVKETLINSCNNSPKIPVIEFNMTNKDLEAYYEGSGLYIQNKSGFRTGNYKSIEDIDKTTLKILKNL